MRFPDLLRRSTPSGPEIDERARAAIAGTAAPVFWLLGKVQSGKSSIIRTLTGLEKIAIGRGFKAVTKSSALYDYPAADEPLLRFLDTRGLFEAGYDPGTDLAIHQDLAHLLVVVVRAGDMALDPLVDVVRRIKRARPEWPILLVQTCLHDLYGAGASHLEPHPEPGPRAPAAGTGEFALRVKTALAAQRSLFDGLVTLCVAVDFTQPEDGFTPHDYGAEPFIEAIEALLPDAGWALLPLKVRRAAISACWQSAQPHIAFYSAAAATAAAVPIPFTDMPVIAAIQLKLLHSIAGSYQQPLTAERLKDVFGALGLTAAARIGWRGLAKLIPGGVIPYTAYTAASTYALGNAFCAYFQFVSDGAKPRPDMLRRVYHDAFEVSRRLWTARSRHSTHEPPANGGQ